MLPWATSRSCSPTSPRATSVGFAVSSADGDTGLTGMAPLWDELREAEGYHEGRASPRKLLWRGVRQRARDARGSSSAACSICPRRSGIFEHMFFVAESITEESRGVPGRGRALRRRAETRCPVRGGLHGGLGRVPGSATGFPAVPITTDDVRRHFTELGAHELSVEMTETEHRCVPGTRR